MTEQERAMAAIDPAVALAITVAVNSAKESFEETLSSELGRMRESYRTCATCNEKHLSIDRELSRIDKTQFWMLTATIMCLLSAVGALFMAYVNTR